MENVKGIFEGTRPISEGMACPRPLAWLMSSPGRTMEVLLIIIIRQSGFCSDEQYF
jgi:hypothetical protein